ncbi:MAG: hypothetical protein LBI06_02425 [Treponema sp.]|jgi:hypothetical protein|nr:hypothetical protein [Treponema sp.]
MKKAIKLFGIVALMAVIGFTMAACGDDPKGDPVLIVQNLSTYPADDPVYMMLYNWDTETAVIDEPWAINKGQQWEVSGLPVGVQFVVVTVDNRDDSEAFMTDPFTLKAGETKTLVYRGGGDYADPPDDFPN